MCTTWKHIEDVGQMNRFTKKLLSQSHEDTDAKIELRGDLNDQPKIKFRAMPHSIPPIIHHKQLQ